MIDNMKTNNALFSTQSCEATKSQWGDDLGLRREAKRHAAFVRATTAAAPKSSTRSKAVSPLRSATAVQIFASLLRLTRHGVATAACVFALMPIGLSAATNDLSGLLQRGLFEEEANRNLDAAAQAYQTVSAQFDKDRKLAATAIFRLGEIYRKQGKTNEAVGQYERIVREFADQDTLVTLSRQNLAGLVTKPAPVQPLGFSDRLVATISRNGTTSDAEVLKRIKKLTREELRETMATLVPDQTLNKLLEQRDASRIQLAELAPKYGASHPEIIGLVNTMKARDEQIDVRIAGIIKALEIRAAANESSSAEVKPKQAPDSTVTTVLDEEEAEIRRIQAMIQNSPDLINAGQKSPIFPAVEAGYLRVVRFLLDQGADVNARSAGVTPLHAAARRGQKAMAELLLSRGANVNARNTSAHEAERERTPLHEAANEGFQAVAEVLLANKADGAAREAEGNTPLHIAAKRDRAKVVGLLAARAANVNAENSAGITPLAFAAAYGSLETVKALLDAGAAANEGKRDQPLLAAINFGKDAAVVELLLRRAGANPNHVGAATRTGIQNITLGASAYPTTTTTPLRAAVERGDFDIVRLLLQFKADANAVGEDGRTALSLAVGNTNLVKLLLEAKADPNLGMSDLPLLLAVRANNDALVELLLRAGANPNQETECEIFNLTSAPDSPGPASSSVTSKKNLLRTGRRGKRTPLQIAVAEERPAMTKLLLHFKADPKSNDADGFPLVLSALGNTDSVKALLDAGADPDASDGHGRYALLRAASTGNSAVVNLLLAHGAKTEVRGDGYTPLLAAIEIGSTNCVSSLLAAGADVNAKNESDWSALHYAVGLRRMAILQMLLAKGANPNVRNNTGQTPLDLTKSQPGAGVVTTLRSGEEPRANPKELATLLRQHGALDDLPNLDRIEIRRPEARFAKSVFLKATNDWNRFTLLDVLFVSYFSGELNFQQVHANGQPTSFAERLSDQLSVSTLPFPDLHRIVVVRAGSKAGQQPNRTTVDLILPTGGVDCAKDIPLEFGDVVEIPEREHTLQENAVGLMKEELQAIARCREGTVGLVVRGKRTELKVWPISLQASVSQILQRSEVRSALFSSSDLSRVKVTRQKGASTKPNEWIVDCSGGKTHDLWLRDGDVIEVPDKQ